MRPQDFPPMNTEDMEIEAAWLHLVEGLTQAEIAERRGLSPVKVHRLVQAAQKKGFVRVFMDRVPSICVKLETRLMSEFGLRSCTVVPTSGRGDMFDSLDVVGTAGARFLYGMLDSTERRIIGIGSGRTIARVVRHLPPINRPNTTFVSITGDFASMSEANPMEVVHTLMRKTGGSGYALTAPLIVDDRKDRDLFLRQRSVRDTLEKAADAEFFLIGIGHFGRNSFLDRWGLVSDADKDALDDTIVADLAGHLIGIDGKPKPCKLAERLISLNLHTLASRPVYAICCGVEKKNALKAALRSGLLDGLVVTADLAESVVSTAEPVRARSTVGRRPSSKRAG